MHLSIESKALEIAQNIYLLQISFQTSICKTIYRDIKIIFYQGTYLQKSEQFDYGFSSEQDGLYFANIKGDNHS